MCKDDLFQIWLTRKTFFNNFWFIALDITDDSSSSVRKDFDEEYLSTLGDDDEGKVQPSSYKFVFLFLDFYISTMDVLYENLSFWKG